MAVQAHREEEAEVEILNANLLKLKTLTKKIQGSITRLDESGQVVKDAIGPIYSNTQQLQTTNRNIDRMGEAIERVRQPLDAQGKEESIIRAGPERAGLQQYLGALRRVDHALADLKGSNMRSNKQAIAGFDNLLTHAAGQLKELFRQQLSQNTSPIEPLHHITKNIDFPQFSDQVIANLKPMAAAITAAAAHSSRPGVREDNAAARIYADIRGPYLASSLQNLATASINTSTKKAPGADVYRVGTSGVGSYARGLEGMFSAEADNVMNIFSRGEVGWIVETTCQRVMLEFSRVLKELNAYMKPRVLTDCFLAFEIIDLVTPISYRLEPKCGSGLKSQFSEALRPIRETARSSLSEIYEQTRQKALVVAMLPNDGNTVPIVSDTISRLSMLSAYPQPLRTILSSLGDGNWRSSSTTNTTANHDANSSTDSSVLLANYITDVLDVLFTSLESRAKAFHRSKTLQGCFLSNTVAVIDRSATTSPDLSRFIEVSASYPTRLESWQKRARSLYLDAWKDPSSHLLDVQYTSRTGTTSQPSTTSGIADDAANRPLSGSSVDSAAIVKVLSSKDRDRIKDKFKAFNASFDEMVARHRSLFMEREVRALLGREVQAMIEPLYARFWDRYHEVDKGKGKNVKYSKADLSNLLIGLA